MRYTYRFAERGRADGAWWTRSEPEVFLQPVTRDDPRLRGILLPVRQPSGLAGHAVLAGAVLGHRATPTGVS